MPEQEMQKITVELPKALLNNAKAMFGVGNTELIRYAIREVTARRAQQELAKMRGTLKPSLYSIEEMRSWDD